MKKLLIAFLTALLAILGGGTYIVSEQMGWAGTEGKTYLVNAPTHASSTIEGCRRSIYSPTSTAPSGYKWTCATTTDFAVGTVPLLIAENTARVNLDICLREDEDTGILFWLAHLIDGGMSPTSTISTGKKLEPGSCWNMTEYGIIWPGPVYSLSSTTDIVSATGLGTSTAYYIEYTQ